MSKKEAKPAADGAKCDPRATFGNGYAVWQLIEGQAPTLLQNHCRVGYEPEDPAGAKKGEATKGVPGEIQFITVGCKPETT